eukprot:SAG11_NODE_23240_length_392_cov_1.054608_1_plen_107_part_10
MRTQSCVALAVLLVDADRARVEALFASYEGGDAEAVAQCAAVHELATALKLWLSQLPEPVLGAPAIDSWATARAAGLSGASLLISAVGGVEPLARPLLVALLLLVGE